MIELIVNNSTQVAHLRLDGRTFEECNIDQILIKSISNQPSVRAAAEYAQAAAYELCERCFYVKPTYS